MSLEKGKHVSRRSLVFDLDGTLIDSRYDIAAACNRTLRERGRAEQTVETICGFVGNGASYLLENLFDEELNEEQVGQLLEIYQGHYLRYPAAKNRMMPGAVRAMSRDQGRAIALCTNKPPKMTEAVIQALSWQQAFDCVVAPDEGERKKPAPDPLLRVAEELNVEPCSLVMIGDGPQDVGAGKAVGAHTIGVRGGLLPVEQLISAKPDVLLDSLEQLPRYLIEADI